MSLTGPLISVSQTLSLSYQQWFTDTELALQKQIVLAREYHEGERNVPLTDRLKEFLGDDVKFRLNVTRSVVTAVSERLNVMGFNSTDVDLIIWAWNVWVRNKLTALQKDIYENALRDGSSYMCVDWDNDLSLPVMIPHQRFVDTSAGGDGYGCWVVYAQNDPNQKPLYGVKQWVEYADSQIFMRRNLYYPERIEKYVSTLGSHFEPYQSGDELWPLPWVDNQGRPLGIAVVDFQNDNLRCEAWDAFPLQNAINKSMLDLLTSADLTAFRIFYALGFIPTTDGRTPQEDRSNWMKLQPGQVVGTTRSAKDTQFGAVDPSDLKPLMDLTHQLIMWLATVTNTPISRFVSTKLIASDETLKEQEGPLLARVTARQSQFGDSWVRCFDIARRLQNTYGIETINEESQLAPLWGDPASRGEQEKLDILLKKKALGVPRQQLWKEAGYDQKTINSMDEMSQQEVRDERRRQGPERGSERGSPQGASGNV